MANSNAQLISLAPLGAGDLIDRSVRLYRSHFVTLIRIAAPPVILSAVGSVMWSLSVRNISKTTSEGLLAAYIGWAALSALLLICSNLLYLIVMGGAARNLVAHILWDEPVSMRSTYRNVRARFWSLLLATMLVAVISIFALMVTGVAWLTVFYVAAILTALLAFASVPVWIIGTIGVVVTIASVLGAVWFFFLLVGRVAYVPQVLLVEGKGVFESLSRSAQLAHRSNARRLAALVLFSAFATYAALALCAVPLGWYAYLHGVDLLPFTGTNHPVWYDISYKALAQISTMLLAPVLITGLSLLYVDERVRREAYDIELMAMNRLGPMPKLRDGRLVPFEPALVADPSRLASDYDEKKVPGSVLGLR